MARLIVEEQKEIPTLPADSILHVIVDSVDVRTVNGPRGDWDKLEFKFKILGIQSAPGAHPSNFENLIGEFIYGSTPFRITDSQENKLRLWAEAILNRPLELGFELDTDYFLKREVRVVTSTYEKRAKDSQGRPFIGHQANSLLPMGNGQGVVPGAPAQAAPLTQAPQQWGAPQQAAPVDPWATQQTAPAQTAPAVSAAQQAPAGAASWEEPPF